LANPESDGGGSFVSGKSVPPSAGSIIYPNAGLQCWHRITQAETDMSKI